MVKISRANKQFSRLRRPSLSEVSISERYDLQEFIFNSVEAFCDETNLTLTILAKEVPPSDAVADRIDLLALDDDGNTVVIELKRGHDRLQLLQAIAYAGMIAKWSEEEIRSKYGDKWTDRTAFDFEEGINHDQRIVLIAEEYDYEVLIGAEWLSDKGIDITCVRVALAVDDETNEEYLEFSRVFPPPELDEIAKARKRSQQSGPVAAGPVSWTDALSGAANDTVKEFFRRQVAAGRENSLRYRRIDFSAAGHRFGTYLRDLRGGYGYVVQQGRFAGDTEFWSTRLSEPHIRPRRASNELGFELHSGDDFTKFEEALKTELGAVSWGSEDASKVASA